MSMLRLSATMCCCCGIACAFALDSAPAKAAGYHVVASHLLGGSGGWDLLSIDAAARRLYIARADRAMIVDADEGTLLAEVPGHGVHGIAVDRATNHGFITNGADSTVTMFDLTTFAILAQAKTGTKPDAIIFDPASKQVYVCDNGGTDVTVLSPSDASVVATIEVGGAPELVAVDGRGRLYTNLEDKNQVAAVDTLAHRLIAAWPLAPGEGPSGVAIDAEHHRLFSACHDSRTLEVLDADRGDVIATLPIGQRCDGAVFDGSTGNVCVPNGDGTLSIYHEDDPDHYTALPTVTTKPGARTIALDERTARMYVVSADRRPTDADAAPNARPSYVDGTFMVQVIGR